MNYLKTYEELDENPYHSEMTNVNIGDYIITKEEEAEDVFKYFLDNNIGKVVSFFSNGAIVRYKNIPDDMISSPYPKYSHGFNTDNTWWVEFKNIVCISNNKEDLEHYISAKKYNL